MAVVCVEVVIRSTGFIFIFTEHPPPGVAVFATFGILAAVDATSWPCANLYDGRPLTSIICRPAIH